MCSLDFPWGHVRLTPAEFEEYVCRYRPHESLHALDFYHSSSQVPRLRMGEMASFTIRHRFEILEWRRSKARYQDHYSTLDEQVLDECLAQHPAVTVDDLMTTSYTMVLRKR